MGPNYSRKKFRDYYVPSNQAGWQVHNNPEGKWSYRQLNIQRLRWNEMQPIAIRK